MYLLHKSPSDLKHPNHNTIPENLQWYASAVHHFRDFWSSDEKVAEFLCNLGNRDTYVTTCLAYLRTLADTFLLWQKQVLTNHSLNTPFVDRQHHFTLDMHQQTIYNHVLTAVTKRALHYSTFMNMNQCEDESDSNFLRPYGLADSGPSEETIFRRLAPLNCEWLLRPLIAASEFADTISQNLNYLSENNNPIIENETFKEMKNNLSPFMGSLQRLNTQTDNGPAKPSDIKQLMKTLC